jgi:hypothetical protein
VILSVKFRDYLEGHRYHGRACLNRSVQKCSLTEKLDVATHGFPAEWKGTGATHRVSIPAPVRCPGFPVYRSFDTYCWLVHRREYAMDRTTIWRFRPAKYKNPWYLDCDDGPYVKHFLSDACHLPTYAPTCSTDIGRTQTRSVISHLTSNAENTTPL